MTWYRLFVYSDSRVPPDYADLDDVQAARFLRLKQRRSQSSYWDVVRVPETEVVIKCHLLKQGDIVPPEEVEQLLARYYGELEEDLQ